MQAKLAGQQESLVLGKASASGSDLSWKPVAELWLGTVQQLGDAARPSLADSVSELPASPSGMLQRLRSFKFRREMSKGATASLHLPDGGSADWSIQASRTPDSSQAVLLGTTTGDDGLDLAAMPESPSTPLSKLRQLKLRQQLAAERRLESAGSAGTPPRTSAAQTPATSSSAGRQPGRQILSISQGGGAWTSSPSGVGGGAEMRFKSTTLAAAPPVGVAYQTAVPPEALPPPSQAASAQESAMKTIQDVIQELQHLNRVNLRDGDWKSQHEALMLARIVISDHPVVLLPCLHAFVAEIAPIIDSLRSIPARLAIKTLQELVEAVGTALDGELPHFLPLLVRRCGGDGFLAQEADRALSAVIASVTGSRSASVLLHCLATIKAPDARAKAATYLHKCLQRHGQRLVSSPLFEKILRAAVLLLDEGSLEARSAGKHILRDLHAMAGRETFRKSLFRLEVKTDKVLDVM